MEDLLQNNIHQFLPEIIRRTAQNGGATFDFKTLNFVGPEDYWYFPKHPGFTQIVSPQDFARSLASFVHAHYADLLQEETVFGTWINPYTHKIFLDINTFMKNKQEAIHTAKALSQTEGRQIVSIYNPFHNITEYITH